MQPVAIKPFTIGSNIGHSGHTDWAARWYWCLGIDSCLVCCLYYPARIGVLCMSFSDTPDTSAQINQLQQQQALFTQIVKEMLQGKWSGGADTAEGLLYALDPNMTGTLSLDTPVTHSQADSPPKG